MLRVWPLFLSLLFFQLNIIVSVEATTLWSKQAPSRIVSLSPHITETLFALGLGHQVIAVTDYCDFPKQAQALPKVGGFLAPNLEAIIALEADLVILLASQQKTSQQLNQLGIKTLLVNNRTLSDIQSTISAIGHATRQQATASKLLAEMAEKIATIEHAVESQSKPRVMIAISHHLGDNAIDTLYLAGQQDFYNDLLLIAGGQNVYQHLSPSVPSISREGILTLNPDIIIDIFPEADDHTASLDDIRSQWMALTSVRAVQHNQVHLIEADYATIPGPRIVLLLEQFARLIHPNLIWPHRSAP